MRRVLVGMLWILAFWIGIVMLGGGIVGAIAGAKAGMQTQGGVIEGWKAGRTAGRPAGHEFGRKYTGFIFLGSVILGIAGTVTGILPGTKKSKKNRS